MSVTVVDLADKLKISPELLIQQLQGAGIKCEKGLKHVVTEAQKQKLLEKLQSDHSDKDKRKVTCLITMKGYCRIDICRLLCRV